MKIYFFERNPETGFFKAGYTVEGRRYVSLVRERAGLLYVSTGARVTNDLQRHWFSTKQAEAFMEFYKGSQFSVEYKEAIA